MLVLCVQCEVAGGGRCASTKGGGGLGAGNGGRGRERGLDSNENSSGGDQFAKCSHFANVSTWIREATSCDCR